jgi:hypothetical protein
MDIVLAARPPRCFACRLNGRQQQRDQNSNDRNNDQELHQGETTARTKAARKRR